MNIKELQEILHGLLIHKAEWKDDRLVLVGKNMDTDLYVRMYIDTKGIEFHESWPTKNAVRRFFPDE